MATVQAVTNGTAADYAIFGTLALGTAPYADISVSVASGNIQLVVTPTSASATTWTTQFRLV
jgi:predicted Na+-dependent transporter